MQTSPKPEKAQRKNVVFLSCLFGVALYLYLNLFTLHNIPYLRIGDQGFFWEYAFRMLQGDHVYRDFFQFTPPGADLFYLSLFKLFGASYSSAYLGLILLGVALFGTCFSVAHRILSRNQALLTAATVIVLIFGEQLDGTHHWFSITLSLCAVRALMPERTFPRIVAAGVLTALAAFFTQTTGAAALIALLLALLWEHFAHRKSWKLTSQLIAMLVTTFILVSLAMNAHFVIDAGWPKFLFLQVTYPHHYVLESHGFIAPDMRSMLHLRTLPRLLRHLFVYSLLAIYAPILWYCRRKRRAFESSNDMQIVLLALLGLLLMLQIITRANWTRIYAVTPPALILLSWSVAHFTSSSFQRRAIIVAFCAIACLAILQTHGRNHNAYQVATLPAGKAVLPATQFEQYTWLAQHTLPGDYFFQANWLDVYVPLSLRNPVFAEDFVPNERMRPDWVTLAIQQIDQRQVKYILWSPQWSNPNHAESPTSDHLGPLRTYIGNHYILVHVFSNRDEIWQRH
jgi:hypothetical protein